MTAPWLHKGLVAAGIIAALCVEACTSDDDKSGARDGAVTEADSGTTGDDEEDAGGGGADEDAGADGGAPTVMCGAPAEACSSHKTSLGVTPAGCAENEAGDEVCGISSAAILMGAEPQFLEKDAPGVASPGCGAFYDALEPAPDGGAADGGAMGNGMIDVSITLSGLDIQLSYPGCCTAAGFCSGDGSKGKANLGAGVVDSNSGYGCMKASIFFAALPEAVRQIPCDPETGELKLPVGDAGADAATDGGSDAGDELDAGSDGG